MVNFSAYHFPTVSSITALLHDLVKTDMHFQRGPEQNKALSQIKYLLADPQHFDLAMRTRSHSLAEKLTCCKKFKCL